MPPESESRQPAPEVLASLLDGAPGDAPAVVCPDDGSVLTYAGLAEAADRVAGLLRGAGAERGDRVALMLPNGPDVIEAVLGVGLLGAMAAPLNPAYKADECAFYLEDLDPRLLVLPPGEYPDARAGAPASVAVAELDRGDDGVARLARNGRELSPRGYEGAQPDDVALLLHTSGTTSRPKQVPLRQRNLAYSARSIAAFYGLGEDDVSYCAMPLFHVHGLVASTFAALASGGTVVIPRGYRSRGFWTQARDHGVTWFSAGPTTHRMALDARAGAPAPATLRFVRACSSALPPELMARAEAEYDAPVLEAYGMTEASHQMASNPLPPAARRPGSVGVSAGAELAILDERGRALEPGERGEVAVRGPGVTSGYLNNPAANAESFAGGWFRTGDIGELDGDGYLRLRGRIKEMILRGGENISPHEVEAVLLSHPAVSDVVCFAVEDPRYGEVVGAAVTLEGDPEVAGLTAHCHERLASFKVPTVVHVLDEIPRTATGKVQRRHVAASLSDGR